MPQFNSVLAKLPLSKSLLSVGLILMYSYVNAVENNTESLQGPTFSNHTHVKPMKQQWVDKKVTYDEKIKRPIWCYP